MSNSNALGDSAESIFWMRRALAEAEFGAGYVEPNPLVGAVVVRGGELVGIGRHERFGGPHAEVVALASAGERARGATLYVTLEPCSHFGKTPPCVDAIVAAGIVRVVAAMRDPFPRVAGEGFRKLRAAGVSVEIGPLERDAIRLNAPYLKRLLIGRPFVVAKWATTLDGKIATAAGDSRWITGIKSRALVHEIRGKMDAILIGGGTAIADDPLLTVRPRGPRTPVRVVLDGRCRLEASSRLVRSARETPVLVAVGREARVERVRALESAGCRVVMFSHSKSVPILEFLDLLGSEGTTNVLVEGGGTILGAFFDSGEVDAVETFIAPIVEGGTHRFSPVAGGGVASIRDATRFESIQTQVLDNDIHISCRYSLERIERAIAARAGEKASSVDDESMNR